MDGKNKGNIRTSSNGYKIDVREVTCEHETPAPINPDIVTIEIADFADCLTISYKNVDLYFDVSKVEDLTKLVDELVNSFNGTTDGSIHNKP